MTLDEAIKHFEQEAERLETECPYIDATEHRQLAEWLRELKAYREQFAGQKCSVCKYQDSDYYCDHCMRTYDDKFEEVR